MERYFVDSRVGCVAVRDRWMTDPDDQGLHEDTTGVVWYRQGQSVDLPPCPTCGHSNGKQWIVSAEDLAAAQAECDKLNRGGK